MRYLVTHVLRRAGYEAIGCATAAELRERLLERTPDVVLLDVRLPDANGIEVLKELRANSALRRTLIIHLSGVATSSDSQAAGLDAGADGYLLKPIDDRVLVSHVRALLRLRAAESALVDQHEHELTQLSRGNAGAPRAVAKEGWRERYQQLLGLAVEERILRADHRIASNVRELAGEMRAAEAQPADVIGVHLDALKATLAAAPEPKHQVLVEEARLMVLQLMGFLLDAYRADALA